MNRRRFLASGGVIASTGILTTFAMAETDSGEVSTETDAITSREQRRIINRPESSFEETDSGEVSTETEAVTSEKQRDIVDSSETTLGEIEETALESPEELSEEDVERLLSAHENHSACPICQGFQSGGMGSIGMGSP